MPSIMQETTYYQSFRQLGRRLAIAYLTWSVCRLFFLVFNYQSVSSSSSLEIIWAFIVGLLFDTVPIGYYNSLFVVLHIIPNPWKNNKGYQGFLKYLFVFTNGVGIAQSLIDIGYFDFSKKRTGAEILTLSKDFEGHTMDYVLDFWYISLLFIAVMALLIFLYKRTESAPLNPNPWRQKIGLQLLCFLGSVALLILALRGGFFRLPLKTFDAAKMVPVNLVPLTTNTPFQFISTVEDKGVEEYNVYDTATVIQLIKPVKSFASAATPFKADNVVILILESFGKEYIGYFNNGKGYTPFFDSLCQKSLVFEHSYANGSISMDAPPAIFSGLPKLTDESFITSRYNTNTLNSIGSLLSAKGYTASFYHGGHNGTMNFDSFVSITQSGKYYGRNEYPDQRDFDGSWGIADEPYLQYFAHQMNESKQPFYSALFTLSSHHPYYVPAKYQNILPKGTLPIHQSIGYTDLSLRKFFETASKMPWFKNTLFVITADHTSDSENNFYQTPEGKYRVPIIFYKGDGSLAGKSEKTIQQVDILPSVMDYLHYDKPFYALGQSVFDTTGNGSAMMYTDGVYQMISYPYQLQIEPSGNLQLYNVDQDHFNSKPLQNDSIKALLEKTTKATLQLYSKGLRYNGMYIRQ